MYYTSHLNMWIKVQNEDSKVGGIWWTERIWYSFNITTIGVIYCKINPILSRKLKCGSILQLDACLQTSHILLSDPAGNLWFSVMIATFTWRIVVYTCFVYCTGNIRKSSDGYLPYWQYHHWFYVILMLFLHQCPWYAVLADAIHLHILTVDGVVTANKKSDFIVSCTVWWSGCTMFSIHLTLPLSR